MKKRDYSTSYCADGAVYYETFVLALQHHPEYNYSLVIWKSTDGTFDYRAGNDLSAAQITGKIKQANAKANAIIPRIIRDGMTRKQKLRAIHNYLVKNCVYDENARRYGYDDAYTAYGCLIEKKAVCQGYAGVFNLLAAKAGTAAVTARAAASRNPASFFPNLFIYRSSPSRKKFFHALLFLSSYASLCRKTSPQNHPAAHPPAQICPISSIYLFLKISTIAFHIWTSMFHIL